MLAPDIQRAKQKGDPRIALQLRPPRCSATGTPVPQRESHSREVVDRK